MEYLFSILLLALNLFDYEVDINKIVFLGLSVVLLGTMIYFIHKRSQDFLCTCITAMCHVWPISWVNIFGDPSYINSMQITWFYFIGLLVVGYFFANIKKLINKNIPVTLLAAFSFIAAISVYPILLSPSKTSAMKDFIMIGFFLFLTFVGTLMGDTISQKNRRYIVDAYIFCVSISSVLLIVQYLYYTVTGVAIFKYSVGSYLGGTMVSSKLLMDDASSATIMLATGVFYMLERINRKEKTVVNIILIFLTVAGLACTTRRTPVVSLAICLILYVLFVYKDPRKKALMLGFVGVVLFVMLTYLAATRSVNDLRGLLFSNGRAQNYKESFELFLKHPFGIGYDNDNLALYFSEVIPHNSFLRWLNMCGFPFVLAMLWIIICLLRTAFKKKLTDDFWTIFCSFIAMNFIPDLLNARFFVIPCMLALMSVSEKKANHIVDVGNKSLDRTKNSYKKIGWNN